MVKEITFGGIHSRFAHPESAAVSLTSIPYDKTSTWGKGADNGFSAFLEASLNLELYDIETDSEVYKQGIWITPPVLVDASPEKMVHAAHQKALEMLVMEKFATFFGGEHSISIGIIRAFAEKFENLTVLQLDAHTDLRKSYNGSPFNHACALHEANISTNLIQVGIRSMDTSEKKYLKPGNCFFAENIRSDYTWMDSALKKMTEEVYITLDLDVFDPSIMPSTGTPEPGGMGWYEVLDFLGRVFTEKNVLGFDIVELAPNPSNKAPDFLAAKLYYKMLSYKFHKK